ncbi:MAG: PorV/PorQ family protein [Elusimicrobia bacterium]|nr:PorV/PorQ family protein [Elusimicrobiota bacterium]
MRTLLIAAVMLACGRQTWAGAQGETPVDFLLMDAGARPAALGGAYVSLAGDANALHYNPAGLAFLEKHEAAFMHAEHSLGSSQEYAALAFKGPMGPLGAGSGAGLMINTIGFGSVQRTTLSNIRGAGLDTFGARDWVLAAGYARKLPWEWVSAGLAAKWIREELDGVGADSGAVDVGLMAELQKPLSAPVSVGVALQNMGADLKYQSSNEPLPLNLRFGASWMVMKGGFLALELNQPSRGEMTVHAGAEYVAGRTLALRVGYDGRNGTDSGIAAGVGLMLKGLELGYAFAPFGSLGDSHRFSVAWRW